MIVSILKYVLFGLIVLTSAVSCGDSFESRSLYTPKLNMIIFTDSSYSTSPLNPKQLTLESVDLIGGTEGRLPVISESIDLWRAPRAIIVRNLPAPERFNQIEIRLRAPIDTSVVAKQGISSIAIQPENASKETRLFRLPLREPIQLSDGIYDGPTATLHLLLAPVRLSDGTIEIHIADNLILEPASQRN